MAISGTGKWAKKASEPSSSVDNKDFFSGIVSVDNDAYEDDKTFLFGFAAITVIIRNSGSGICVFKWLRHVDDDVDNGVIDPGERLVIQDANKQGILLRKDGGATVDVDVMAV